MKIIGMDERGFPSQAFGHCDYTVVLTESEGPEPYACYIGQGSPEWVANHGDKLTFERAKLHFPISPMTPETYRR